MPKLAKMFCKKRKVLAKSEICSWELATNGKAKIQKRHFLKMRPFARNCAFVRVIALGVRVLNFPQISQI